MDPIAGEAHLQALISHEANLAAAEQTLKDVEESVKEPDNARGQT